MFYLLEVTALEIATALLFLPEWLFWKPAALRARLQTRLKNLKGDRQ